MIVEWVLIPWAVGFRGVGKEVKFPPVLRWQIHPTHVIVELDPAPTSVGAGRHSRWFHVPAVRPHFGGFVVDGVDLYHGSQCGVVGAVADVVCVQKLDQAVIVCGITPRGHWHSLRGNPPGRDRRLHWWRGSPRRVVRAGSACPSTRH